MPSAIPSLYAKYFEESENSVDVLGPLSSFGKAPFSLMVKLPKLRTDSPFSLDSSSLDPNNGEDLNNLFEQDLEDVGQFFSLVHSRSFYDMRKLTYLDF